LEEKKGVEKKKTTLQIQVKASGKKKTEPHGKHGARRGCVKNPNAKAQQGKLKKKGKTKGVREKGKWC